MLVWRCRMDRARPLDIAGAPDVNRVAINQLVQDLVSTSWTLEVRPAASRCSLQTGH
jgi:hypothetical protein